MTFSDLNSFVALLLAISLATERVITALKNLFPWFAREKITLSGAPDLDQDRVRRTLVQLMAVLVGWTTAAFLTPDGRFEWSAKVAMGTSMTSPHVYAWLVGLLASSGSALWSSVLGYTSAAKDIQKAAAATSNQGVLPMFAAHRGHPAAAQPALSSLPTRVNLLPSPQPSL